MTCQYFIKKINWLHKKLQNMLRNHDTLSSCDSKHPVNKDFTLIQNAPLTPISTCFSLKIWPVDEDLNKHLSQTSQNVSWKWLIVTISTMLAQTMSIPKIANFYPHCVDLCCFLNCSGIISINECSSLEKCKLFKNICLQSRLHKPV